MHTDPLLVKIAKALTRILDKYEMEEAAKKELKGNTGHTSREAKKRAKWLMLARA